MEGRDIFDGSLANSSGCDSNSSSLTIRTTQDSNVDSPVQFRRIPSTPGMSVNRIVPEVGKCMANMTDDEFETIDFDARRRQMTLNILARTRHLQLIPPDPKLGSSPRSPSSSLSDSPKDKAKNKARKKNDKANSGPIPSLRKASTELQPQSPRPLLQKSLSELRGTAPTLPAQITLNKVRRPAPLSLSNIQSVQLSAAAATRNRIVTDPLPGPLTDYLVSALPTVPNSPPLMSPAMRALVDPILLPIQSPAKLSQPRFSLDARERPEDFAEHPVFQTEGDIDIRGHHHNKVSTLLGEISKLNIVTQASQAPVKNEEYDPLEKYSEKNRQKRINHVLGNMVSFSLKNVSEFSPLSTPTILPHPIPLQGNTCTKPAAPETAKTLRDIKMIDVKRDEGVDDPEDTVLAGSARKQSWVTGIQTAGPNALRDSEYHGYSAHWGHKDNANLPLSVSFRKKLETSCAFLNVSQHGLSDHGISSDNRSSMSTIDETLEIMKRLPGGDYVRRAAVLKSVKKDVGGPIDVDALVKMTKIHERRKSIMMERSGSLTHIPTTNMGKENNRVSSIDSDKANTEISEEFGESIEIDTAEGIFEAK